MEGTQEPKWAKKGGRKTKPQQTGLSYERKVAALLEGISPIIMHGPWLTFHDDSGPRTCQPDYLILRDDDAIIVEVKLTYTPDAERKLLDFYRPIVKLLLDVDKVRCIQIYRNGRKKWLGTLQELVSGDFSYRAFRWDDRID